MRRLRTAHLPAHRLTLPAGPGPLSLTLLPLARGPSLRRYLRRLLGTTSTAPSAWPSLRRALGPSGRAAVATCCTGTVLRGCAHPVLVPPSAARCAGSARGTGDRCAQPSGLAGTGITETARFVDGAVAMAVGFGANLVRLAPTTRDSRRWAWRRWAGVPPRATRAWTTGPMNFEMSWSAYAGTAYRSTFSTAPCMSPSSGWPRRPRGRRRRPGPSRLAASPIRPSSRTPRRRWPASMSTGPLTSCSGTGLPSRGGRVRGYTATSSGTHRNASLRTRDSTRRWASSSVTLSGTPEGPRTSGLPRRLLLALPRPDLPWPRRLLPDLRLLCRRPEDTRRRCPRPPPRRPTPLRRRPRRLHSRLLRRGHSPRGHSSTQTGCWALVGTSAAPGRARLLRGLSAFLMTWWPAWRVPQRRRLSWRRPPRLWLAIGTR